MFPERTKVQRQRVVLLTGLQPPAVRFERLAGEDGLPRIFRRQRRAHQERRRLRRGGRGGRASQAPARPSAARSSALSAPATLVSDRWSTQLVGMGHLLDRCDVLDLLEESARLKRSVIVELKGGRRFVDQTREVVSEADEEWAVFRAHDRVPVSDIAFCGPADVPEPSYRGKT
jgi:Rho-binding antiterminator